ncbi:hypothetical protein JRG66_08540 [Salinimicrobium tongyeongense]|uniref:Lipoprotein n=1 Tax=Salinimicrobium tongyeongense TaxID=2809707 RepID=A0ABY6NMM4_9FLAO|nr:hypothetical protein [Salinimicrobium tongyeongense]UZH54054.1 hypothetical protein JRG66_08540 [Salinimicrobium tongyeongense]
MRKIFIILSLVFFFSCGEKQEAQVPTITSEKSFLDPLEVNTTRVVNLSPQARELAGEWLAYATAQNEIQALKNSTGQEIVTSANNLVQIMDNLRSTIPDSLQSTAVEARTNVLYTKAQVLHQLSNKKQKNPDEIFDLAEDMVTEFENFKLQLNELFLKTPENFETELDREFEESLEPDSTGTIPLFRDSGI